MGENMIRSVDELDFCFNVCKYRNYYDGWCYYYDKDADEIEECGYYKKKER